MDLESQSGSTAVPSSWMDVIQVQNRTIAELRQIIECHRQIMGALAGQLCELLARRDLFDTSAETAQARLNGTCEPLQTRAAGPEIVSVLEKARRPLRAAQIAARLHQPLSLQLRKTIQRLVHTGLLEERTIVRYHVPDTNGP